jgi:transposase InsO family protein
MTPCASNCWSLYRSQYGSEVTDAEPEFEPLQEALLAWETCYNTVRPHQALGYLTPAEWLEQHGYLVPEV